MSRVSGHGLRNEGAPFLTAETGDLVRVGHEARMYGGVSGRGRGLCECGAVSKIVDSAGKRRSWHREHKQAVSEARPVTPCCPLATTTREADPRDSDRDTHRLEFDPHETWTAEQEAARGEEW